VVPWAGQTCAARRPVPGETDLLNPSNLVDQVHAILLAGGSAYGLDAAGGAMRWLEARGIGIDVKVARGAHRTVCRAV
jgi:L-aminopeptidase/D-esterase-like protein